MRNNLTSKFGKLYSREEKRREEKRREEKRREEKSLITLFYWHAQNCYAR